MKRRAGAPNPRRRTAHGPAPSPARRVDGLPYRDVLTPHGFELFCAELIHRSSTFASIQNYGGTGHAQKGIDITAYQGKALCAFQCKRVANFSATQFDALRASTSFIADKYVLILASSATPSLIDRVRNANWELWDAQGLDRRVASLGDDAFDLIASFFGADWATAFLGKSAPDTFLTHQRFFAPFVSTESAVSLAGPFIGRPEALTALTAFVKSPTPRALVLSGAVGLGKTKLLYEFGNTLEADALSAAVFVREGAEVNEDAIATLPKNVRIIVVDDPARIIRLENLLSHVARVDDVKIVIAVVAGKEGSVTHQLEAFGFASELIVSAPQLGTLKRADTLALFEQLTRIKDDRWPEHIMQVSSGSPLVIRIIAAILNAGDVGLLDAVRNEDSPMDVILGRYQDVLTGGIPGAVVSREHALDLMNVLAAIGPVDIRTSEFRESVSAFLKWEEDALIRAIAELETAGLVVRVGSRSRLVPDILRLFILKRACIAGTLPTHFASKLVSHFGARRQLLLNLAITDQIGLSGGEIFQPVWLAVRARLREAHAYERAAILDELGDLSYLIPDQMLELVEYLLNNPAKRDPKQPLKNLHHFNNDDVLEKVPGILNGIATSSLALVRQCVQLLWALSKKEKQRFSTQGAFATLVALASYGRFKPIALNLEVLKQISEISAQPLDTRAPHLPIDVVEPVLARSFYSTVNAGATMTMTRYAISPTNVASVRREAIAILAAAVGGTSERLALKAMDMLVTCLERPGGAVVPGSLDETHWRDEQRSVVAIFRDVMRSGDNDVLRLRLATRLSWHAYNADEGIRAEVREIIIGIEDEPRAALYAAICYDFARNLPSMPPGQGYGELQASIDGLLDRVVTTIFENKVSPQALLADLSEKFAALTVAGLNPDGGWLFLTLANRDLDYAEAVADAVIESFATDFGSSISAIIHSVWRHDPDIGYSLAKRAIATGSPGLQTAVANALWFQYDSRSTATNDASRQAELLSALLQVPDERVQKAALQGVGTLLKVDRKVAIDLLLSVDVGTNSKLADEVFANLRSIDTTELDSEATDRLLRRLVKVSDLDYWAFEFLRKLGSRRPRDVLRLFRERIAHAGASAKRHIEYKPVPYAGTLLPHVAVFFATIRPSLEHIDELLTAAFRSKRGRYWFAELFGNLAVQSQTLAQAVSHRIDTGDAARLRFLAEMMHRAPSGFVFEQWKLIVSLLEAAITKGDECIRQVESSVFSAATSGLRSGVPFEPMPEDVEMIGRAQAAISLLRPGSRARRFYERVEQHGRREIDRKAEDDEDIFGEPEH